MHFDVGQDAADYLRVVMRFVSRHPPLAKSPIFVSGESHGGMRATHLSVLMLDYQNLVRAGPLLDRALYDETVQFHAARRPDLDSKRWTTVHVGTVFSTGS